MAIKGKVISNPGSGQSIRFIQTGKDTKGQLLEMESVYSAQSKEPVPHYHPRQEEEFQVLEGSINVRINGTVRVLEPGEKLIITAGTVHSMWNQCDREARVNWKVRPALSTEYLLETGMGLAADGKVNEKGMPSVLQTAMLMQRYKHVFRLARPPFFVQRVLFGILAPIAAMKGYRSVYRKYVD